MSLNVFNVFSKQILSSTTWMLMVLCLMSCGGKKTNDSVESDTLSAEEPDADEEYLDTLVYDTDDTPLTEAVDESFLDFFYTFLNRRSFQLQRVTYPVPVHDASGEVVETLKNGRSVSDAFQFAGYDYLVMLLGPEQDPYDYLNSDARHAEIRQMDLVGGGCRSYAFDRQEEDWYFTGIQQEANYHDGFVHFYAKFANDSVFRAEHLSPEIFVSLPSTEDEMEMVDGNIDSGQWDVFSPELPRQSFLLLTMGEEVEKPHSVKFVKCGVASSMMEILTFEREDNDWKLVRYEE